MRFFVLRSYSPLSLCHLFWFARGCLFFPAFVFAFFFSEERRQTCCLFFFFFFFYICQAGKRDVGRDCSAKSAAEWERKLLMNECQSFGFARCSCGHFTWMVSGCVLSATGETKMLHCCWFLGDSWAFFPPLLSFWSFHWLICLRNVPFMLCLFENHSCCSTWTDCWRF